MAREFLDMESLEKSVYNKQSKRTTILCSPLLFPEKVVVMRIIINL